MEHAARVTSSVIFVSDIDRSVDFYRDVFACEVTIQIPRLRCCSLLEASRST